MTAIALALISVVLAITCHAAAVRHLPPRLVMPSLAAVVAAMSIATVLIAATTGLATTPADWIVAVVLALSLGFDYALILVGVIHDSPTLAIVNAIADRGSNGFPVPELDAFGLRHPFVSRRIEALKQDGVLVPDGEGLVVRGGVGLLFRLGSAYGALSRRNAATG